MRVDELTQDVDIPSCHDIKQKLLRRFFTLRFHIYAKKQQDLQKSRTQHSKSGGELGSKSMAMRLAVQKYK